MDDFIKELKSKNQEFSDDYIKKMQEYYKKLLNNPAELQNTLNQLQGKGGIDNEGGITIIPDKYCCIKTFDESGQKIFINLVSSDKVDPPQEQHILEMNNQHGVRIPMSLSEPHEDHDKKGLPCQVYDAIFNPNILKKIETEPMVLQFIMACISGRIKERFKHTIDTTKVIRLKGVIYKGESVRPQRIRAKKVKIEEIINNTNEKDKKVNMNSNAALKTNEINKEIHEKGKTPNWNFVIIKDPNPTGYLFKMINKIAKDRIVPNGNNGKVNFNLLNDTTNKDLFEYYNGYNANPRYGNGLLLIVELELLGKSSAVKLNICDESLTLYCGKFYSLELNLPFKVNSVLAKAMFVVENRLLYVYMPFYEKDIKEIRAITEENKQKEQKVINISEDYLYDVIN